MGDFLWGFIEAQFYARYLKCDCVDPQNGVRYLTEFLEILI